MTNQLQHFIITSPTGLMIAIAICLGVTFLIMKLINELLF